MNYKQENKLSMYLVVINYLSGVPASILLLMPNFQVLFNQLILDVDLIRASNEGQRQDRKGYRVMKDIFKEAMVVKAVNIGMRIKAYAVSVNDVVLAQEMKEKKSFFMAKRDTVCADLCHAIYLKGVELLGDLAAYGVTQDSLDKLMTSVNSFNDYIPLPRKNIVIRRNLTIGIELLMEKCDVSLSGIDTLSDMLELNEVDYFREYFSSRRIVNNRGRKLALRGVVSGINGELLQKVVVSVPLLNLSTKTTVNGYYEFKELPSGVYDFYYAKAGYETFKSPVAITKTIRKNFDVALEDAMDVKSSA